MSDLDGLIGAMRALAADVEQHVTRERVRRYLSALVNTQAPSTFAGPMRGPVLRRLLVEDGALPSERLHFQPDLARTGSPVILTGSPDITKPLWFFAHLDTISYLVRPEEDGRYPLTPFCAHMIVDGTRAAQAYRYDLSKNAFSGCCGRPARVGRRRAVLPPGPFGAAAASGRPCRDGLDLPRGAFVGSVHREHGQRGRGDGLGGRGAGAGSRRRRSHARFPGRGRGARRSRQSDDRTRRQPDRKPSPGPRTRHRDRRSTGGRRSGRGRPGRR